ncbi:Phosphomannomutase [Saitozyma podzolica]|uniref:Phosphomannomutase n=1 Tax=Saitozyma podzolica TaxID=1890683 RepID=A0A427YUN2_9TREE|nr:Phosphomannomutase [Saitozyma podzolica]
MSVKPFSERKLPGVICMFDVDGTLTPARRSATPEILAALKKLREYTAVAIVGGSDFNKIKEQLQEPGLEFVDTYDYVFSENGLTAYRMGKQLDKASFIKHVGEEEYKKLVNWILRYLSEVDIPVKRGTFVEFRNGMINVSPIGRGCSQEEREAFFAYDKIHNIRPKMVEALRKEFDYMGLTFSIGGEISFDVFPRGWDKTYALGRIANDGFKEIHFFGDKTYPGGNDYEIFSDERTIGHSVTSPADTLKLLEELFFSKA